MILENQFDVSETVLQEALAEGLSYEKFRKEVQSLFNTNRVTGAEQSDAFLHYTFMNEKRMDRWEKTLKIPAEVAEVFRQFEGRVTWLVITEGWCGDGAHALPVMKRLADLNEGITLKIVIRDEHPELMNAFLTDGARSIPKLIMIDDETSQPIATWGPRPSDAMMMVTEEKRLKGKLSPEFRAELQQWYNKDKGQNIAFDLAGLIALK